MSRRPRGIRKHLKLAPQFPVQRQLSYSCASLTRSVLLCDHWDHSGVHVSESTVLIRFRGAYAYVDALCSYDRAGLA